MIKIVKTNGSVTILGHANYAEHGKDIVCASISTLFQVFIAGVEKYTSDRLETHISGGMAYVKWEELSEKGQLLLDQFMLGCEMVSESYSEYVRIV